MALHGNIAVNGTMIGHWVARRTSDSPAQPKPDDVCFYACEVSQRETLEGNPAIDWKGSVPHRFGDGAVALATRVLAAALIDTPWSKLGATLEDS